MTQDQRWQIRFDEVKNFMEKEHRKPSKYYPKEKLMFHFIHHNKKLYNARTMKVECVETFESYLCCARSIRGLINMCR